MNRDEKPMDFSPRAMCSAPNHPHSLNKAYPERITSQFMITVTLPRWLTSANGFDGRLAITQDYAAFAAPTVRSRLRFASHRNGCRASTAALKFLPIGFSSDRLGERPISAANSGAPGSALLHRHPPRLGWFHCCPPGGLECVGRDGLAIRKAEEIHPFAHRLRLLIERLGGCRCLLYKRRVLLRYLVHLGQRLVDLL